MASLSYSSPETESVTLLSLREIPPLINEGKENGGVSLVNVSFFLLNDEEVREQRRRPLLQPLLKERML